ALEVRVDGVRAHEEGGRDLAIRLSLCGKLGDLALGRRELIARGGASSDPRELALRVQHPQRRAKTSEDVERLPERCPRGRLALRTTENPALDQERAAEIEWLWNRRVKVDGLVEGGKRGGGVAVGGQGGPPGAGA